jgi:hypothetical protein
MSVSMMAGQMALTRATGFLDQLNGFLPLFFAPTCHRNTCAFFCEHNRGRPSNSRRSSGDMTFPANRLMSILILILIRKTKSSRICELVQANGQAPVSSAL